MIVATYGDQSYIDLARERALPSVAAQDVPVDLLTMHGTDLRSARNRGGFIAHTEWLIFLDADDELAPGYIRAMLEAEGDMRYPAVQYVRPDAVEEPRLLPEKPIERGNWMVIGTMIRTEAFGDVGGFADYPFYEDWDLWWRMIEQGAKTEPVPEAVYRVHLNGNGRNLGPTHREKVGMLRRIRRDHGIERIFPNE